MWNPENPRHIMELNGRVPYDMKDDGIGWKGNVHFCEMIVRSWLSSQAGNHVFVMLTLCSSQGILLCFCRMCIYEDFNFNNLLHILDQVRI